MKRTATRAAFVVLAAASAGTVLTGNAAAESRLDHHRRAVRSADVEQVVLTGVVTGRASDNAVRLNISPSALKGSGIESLDLVQLTAGQQTLPIRIMHSSDAPRFLDPNDGEAGEDVDAVGALVIDDSGKGNDTTLVAYEGAIADAIGARPGMAVRIVMRRYR
jgi:hypothetical protein